VSDSQEVEEKTDDSKEIDIERSEQNDRMEKNLYEISILVVIVHRYRDT